VWNRPGVYTDPTGLFGWPSLQQVSDFSAGFGDTVTFGLTAAARRGLGSDGVVDRSSGSYLGGGITGGVTAGIATGAGVAAGVARLGVTSRAATLGTAASVDAAAGAASEAGNAWAAGRPLNFATIGTAGLLGAAGGAAGACLTKLLTRPLIRGNAEAEGGELSAAFHYTRAQNVASIKSKGMFPGSYATPNGELSPLQAQVDLALPPNRGLTDALLRIDLEGLRSAGYEIPEATRVGRSFNMPGGGFEMQFPYSIPPEFLKVIRP